MRVFSSNVYDYHVNKGKLYTRAKKKVFVRYADGVKGYRIMSPCEGRVILSRNVVFDENFVVNPIVKYIVGPDIGPDIVLVAV